MEQLEDKLVPSTLKGLLYDIKSREGVKELLGRVDDYDKANRTLYDVAKRVYDERESKLTNKMSGTRKAYMGSQVAMGGVNFAVGNPLWFVSLPAAAAYAVKDIVHTLGTKWEHYSQKQGGYLSKFWDAVKTAGETAAYGAARVATAALEPIVGVGVPLSEKLNQYIGFKRDYRRMAADDIETEFMRRYEAEPVRKQAEIVRVPIEGVTPAYVPGRRAA